LKAIIISIGNEITSGHALNTNASWLAKELESIGIISDKIVTIRDNVKTLVDEIRAAVKSFDVVLTTGGLGSTSDDVTKLALVKAFKTRLVRDKKVLTEVMNYYKKINRPMAPVNKQQADVPEGFEVIRNSWGTSPCLGFQGEGFLLYSLPGVPYEMKNIMSHEILKRLQRISPKLGIIRSTMKTIGIGESDLFTLIDNSGGIGSPVEIAYLPHLGQVDLRLTSIDKKTTSARARLNAARKKLQKVIRPYYFGDDDESIEMAIGKQLRKKKLTLACAESCTGGLFASIITSVPGSSDYFLEGAITYTNKAKVDRLGVTESTLVEHGAVSAQTASEMARGIQNTSGSDIGISSTGIAGPAGGTKDKPVGLIYISLAMGSEVITSKLNFSMDRVRTQERTAKEMMTILWQALVKIP